MLCCTALHCTGLSHNNISYNNDEYYYNGTNNEIDSKNMNYNNASGYTCVVCFFQKLFR